MVPICSGSDTGGSLRNPAAFNGIVGYRPSPGVVPSEKRVHGWSGLPVLGPMARNVPDAALLFAAMASDDARDPLAYTLPGEPVRGAAGRYHPLQPIDLASLRLAISADFGQAPVEKLIREAFAIRAKAIAPLFGVAEEADPDCRGGDEAFEVLRAAVFLTAHAQKVRERPQDVGPNVRANVEEGLRYALEDYSPRGGRPDAHVPRLAALLLAPRHPRHPGDHALAAPLVGTLPGRDRRQADPHLFPLARLRLLRDAVRPPGHLAADGRGRARHALRPAVVGRAAGMRWCCASPRRSRRPSQAMPPCAGRCRTFAALKAAKPVTEMPGAVGWD